jgi:hypothetical protein
MNSRARRGGITYALLAFACLALSAGGAVAMREEMSIYLRTGPVIARAKQITPSTTVGFSADGMRATLRDCVMAMQRYKSLEMAYETPETKERILSNCLEISDLIAERAPSFSYAYFSGAFAAILLGDKEGFNARMRRSQLTAPNEQWLVDLRVDLGETHLADLDPAGFVAHEDDLRLMVRSAVGLRNVAKRWIGDEDFRVRIADIVEAMPQETQRRFIVNLERAVRNAGR